MYLELLKTVSNGSKYEKWYCNIIKRAISRVSRSNRTQTQKLIATSLLGYVESHHILPKSFNMGGEKDRKNKVFLTAKEHFICHLLLVKMVNGKNLSKMYYALNRLSNTFKNTSVTYNRLKQNFVKLHSDIMKELWQDQEYRTRVMASREWVYTDPEIKRKMSESQTNLMKDPEFKERCVRPMIEASEKIFAEADKKEWVARSMGSVKGRAKAKEKHQSDEHREFCRQRELAKGYEHHAELGRKRKQIQNERAITKYGSLEAYYKVIYADRNSKRKLLNLETQEIELIKCKLSNIPIGYSLPPIK